MNSLKYVVVFSEKKNSNVAILFKHLEHKDFRPMEPISAGHVSERNGFLYTHDHSHSLALDHNPADVVLVESLFASRKKRYIGFGESNVHTFGAVVIFDSEIFSDDEFDFLDFDSSGGLNFSNGSIIFNDVKTGGFDDISIESIQCCFGSFPSTRRIFD